MARAVQLASDLSQVGLAHHRPWKLRWLPPRWRFSPWTQHTHTEHRQKITETQAPETEVWKNIYIICLFIYRGFPAFLTHLVDPPARIPGPTVPPDAKHSPY